MPKLLPTLDFFPETHFPNPREALTTPNGLLAIGGDLSAARLLAAYKQGIFPWFNEGQPPLWWSPDPRCVIVPADFKPSRSLRRRIKHGDFTLAIDRDFPAVIRACRTVTGAKGTWITPEMEAAYLALHEAGHAHSIEAYQDGNLAGGLYGIALGRLFCGESMFHRAPDASKVAFAHLMALAASAGARLVDCQVPSPHLASLGATLIPRADYLAALPGETAASPIDWQALANELEDQEDLAIYHERRHDEELTMAEFLNELEKPG